MNVIIYSRVSTDEQAERGFSLRNQEEVLRKYCEVKGYNVIESYVDDFSAKSFINRPQWQKLSKHVKSNRKIIDKVLFTKWDRFSRNIEEALTVIRGFVNMGIEINSVEQPLDLSNPDNKVMLAMYLMLPEVENDKISQRTKDGMRRAKKEGCFLAKAPFGYSNTRINEKTSIVPNKDADVVLRAFTEVAKGLESVEVIRRKLVLESGLKLGKQQFYNMLKNKTYCGLITIPEYKKEPAYAVSGLHNKIVDKMLFDEVQDVVAGRKKHFKLPSIINESFPLRTYLLCPKCNKQITASKSKGNGGIYEYYHCKSKCKVRTRMEYVHKSFTDYLGKISLDEKIVDLYKVFLKDVIQKNAINNKMKVTELKKELTTLNGQLENAEDKLVIGVMDSDLFTKIVKRYNDRILEINNLIFNLENREESIIKYVDNSVVVLSGLKGLYEKLNYVQKGILVNAIFPNKIILENDTFRTNSVNSVLQLLTNVFNGLKAGEIKKAIPKNGFSTVAPPLGLEPRTL